MRNDPIVYNEVYSDGLISEYIKIKNINQVCQTLIIAAWLNRSEYTLNDKDDHNQVEINLVIDKARYNNLVDICKKYKEQHGTELTPKEYVLMLIDSAIAAQQ